ncbi:hypothetical protein ES332_A02G146800v1 [Gossypium tomentosum]|uniref:Sulfite exporter TauE/SafE family protein n=1 Tax=Gossypium tomentosum TaxID=34277 RepID=A0A5D2RHE6_GOSTO|nr:hypothetical protein ES332_A02G146800v1 [Gossypium tomentosum]
MLNWRKLDISDRTMLAARSKVWWLIFTAITMIGFFVVVSALVAAEPSSSPNQAPENNYVRKAFMFLELNNRQRYEHQWPNMRFCWQIVVGSVLGFLGAAFGSVGGVGGGGIFVPMLALIIGFDPKSSTAISKSMSTKSFLKGIQTWKRETIKKKEAARHLELNGELTQHEVTTESKEGKPKVSLIENICWKELGLLVVVWILILALQIAKNYSTTCSAEYWVLNFLQIPVTVGVSSYEAVFLYKGRRKIASKGDVVANWRVHKLVIYCGFGVLAGVLGGMLGLGGGFILGPLFLEMGIPPQVSSATATFAMLFSASMSVVEYYLLKRFPIPYALYLAGVATIAAFVGQHVVGKAIKILGRSSIIIFILAGMIFGSAISLGGLGIAKMIKRIERKEYMGFEDICSYRP